MRAFKTNQQSARSGHTLILFVLLLPVLLGLLGLILDLGVLAISDRQAQHAADSAALAAARAKLTGSSIQDMEDAAIKIVHAIPGLESATVTISSPPASGVYSGDDRYVEAQVTHEVSTWFIQVVQGPDKQKVKSRAVAGVERHTADISAASLNPILAPGLTLVGGTVETANPVHVNAHGSGFDENGELILMKNPVISTITGLTGTIRAPRVTTVGGVDFPSHFESTTGLESPLDAKSLPAPDPFLYLETPTTSTGVVESYPSFNGIFHAMPQHVTIILKPGRKYTFDPGIYASIKIAGIAPGASVTFNPGIYVLKGGLPAALSIVTGAKITAEGVMFYNTGSRYDSVTGTPDRNDGARYRLPLRERFGAITIAAPRMTLTGLDDATSIFDGMVIYQRRRNLLPITLLAKFIEGSVYARWSPITLTGATSHPVQLVGGTLVLVNPPFRKPLILSPGRKAKGPFTYLVE